MDLSSPLELGSIDSGKLFDMWDANKAMLTIVFYRHLGGNITLLAVYVDDIGIACNDVKMIA